MIEKKDEELKKLEQDVDKLTAHQQAPVAWMYEEAKFGKTDLRGRQWRYVLSHLKPYVDDGMVRGLTPLYASPQPSKPWVWLTKEDRYKAIRPLYNSDENARLAVEHSNDEYEAIEAKLKEKNT